ncbi:hypothetical protein AURDEDRAFT_175512 [Auricularia subglabra TFB-10046 SS5]|uniref:Uncharacterized protein n=1 Tax=Auricularia subglabra (strain TFB-10046 / SS5) TaxID=717982 RepID=J0LET4_AURST|nr:hypothetical protein AURDEDRAFT_175512 [Auricularia subglabra TFB-10046 SS5]
MALPPCTHDLLPPGWSESSFDWENDGYRQPRPPPLVEDIDWSSIRAPRVLRATAGTGRARAYDAPHPVHRTIDPVRATQFGTLDSVLAGSSRDLLYINSTPAAGNSWTHHHRQYEEKRDPAVGWALVPCVAMRLCMVNNQLHVYAARFADDIWGNPALNRRAPYPGRQHDFPGQPRTVYESEHPLRFDHPHVLLIPLAPWLRRPLQVLIHTATYFYYVRCHKWADLHSGQQPYRLREAYHHELLSNFFTELVEVAALMKLGQVFPGGFVPSTVFHHFCREWYQSREFIHTPHGSKAMLESAPYAYRTDLSALDWNVYMIRVKLMWAYTMGARSNTFSCSRAHRGLYLDCLTDHYLLNFKTHHTPWDMDLILPTKDSTTPKWCLVPQKKDPYFFDTSDIGTPSAIYPTAVIEEPPRPAQTDVDEEDEVANALSGKKKIQIIDDSDPSDADEFIAQDDPRHYPLATPNRRAAEDLEYEGPVKRAGVYQIYAVPTLTPIAPAPVTRQKRRRVDDEEDDTSQLSDHDTSSSSSAQDSSSSSKDNVSSSSEGNASSRSKGDAPSPSEDNANEFPAWMVHVRGDDAYHRAVHAAYKVVRRVTSTGAPNPGAPEFEHCQGVLYDAYQKWTIAQPVDDDLVDILKPIVIAAEEQLVWLDAGPHWLHVNVDPKKYDWSELLTALCAARRAMLLGTQYTDAQRQLIHDVVLDWQNNEVMPTDDERAIFAYAYDEIQGRRTIDS